MSKTSPNEMTPGMKALYEKGLNMQTGAGHRRIADWVLPNDEEPFDDVAKAKEFAEDAEVYVDLTVEAHKHIKPKK